MAKSHAEELSRRKALQDQATQLLAEAKVAMASGDPDALAKAQAKLAQASELADSPEIERDLADVSRRLADTHRAQRIQELNRHAGNARDALTSAEALPRDDQRLDALLRTIDGELAFADADKDLKVTGLPELFSGAQKLRAAHERALQQALDLQRGRTLAASSAAALAGRDSARALADAEQALAFAPSDPAVLAAYKAGSDAKAAADARGRGEAPRRRRGARRAAPGAGRGAGQPVRARAAATAKAAGADAERLAKVLADKPLSDKQQLFQARQAAADAATSELRAWSQGEQIAQQALALLEPWAGGAAPPQDYLKSEAILARLYHQRLTEARAAGHAADAAVMANMLIRADRFAHAYAADFADQGTVTVHGVRDGALVQARRLAVSPDGRLLPSAQAIQVPFDQAMSYAIGSWQFTSGDTMISVVVSPDRPLAIAFPGPTPKVPGIGLRYVPADLHRERDGSPGSLKPFWLGVTEVTYEQYLAFLRDPEIFDQIRKNVASAAQESAENQNGLAGMALVKLMPSTSGGAPLYKLGSRTATRRSSPPSIPFPRPRSPRRSPMSAATMPTHTARGSRGSTASSRACPSAASGSSPPTATIRSASTPGVRSSTATSAPAPPCIPWRTAAWSASPRPTSGRSGTSTWLAMCANGWATGRPATTHAPQAPTRA